MVWFWYFILLLVVRLAVLVVWRFVYVDVLITLGYLISCCSLFVCWFCVVCMFECFALAVCFGLLLIVLTCYIIVCDWFLF